MSNNYSEEVVKILIKADRQRIADQIIGVLNFHLGPERVTKMSCLDLASSGGTIAYSLSKYFTRVWAIDIDRHAIRLAKRNYMRKNLFFLEMDAENMKFGDKFFDVIVCNQVYNFVDNPEKLMSEMYRVLKPKGIIFFSARNKYSVIEPQYNLPFLSWLPKGLGDFYIRLFGRGKKYFGSKYLSYYGLVKLTSKFRLHDYTEKILRSPGSYKFNNIVRYSWLLRLLPIKILLPLVPNYIFILEKI